MQNVGLTDSPIETINEEQLGLKDHVEALSEFIRVCQTPMTIAFQGDWGTGKTSMMNMVKDNLTKSNQGIETRWFNTWQFSQFKMQEEVAISLLSAFLDELGDSAQQVRKAVSNIGRMAAGKIGNIAKAATDIAVGGGGDYFKDWMDKLAESESDGARQLRDLRSDIEKAVHNLLKSKNAARMVIFIDDLDRLVPERAVEILETIKIFLDIPQCVFVLAVDYQVVSKGLEQKFGVSMDDLKGKSFFDKIIQLPFNLPVAQYNIRQYMKTLFSGPVSFGEENLNILVRLAEYSIGTNPRSLKRLLNAMQLLHIVADKKGMLKADDVADREERQRLLFSVLCLQLAYEPVYRKILKDSNGLSSDYIDMFCEREILLENAEAYGSVKKCLSIGSDPEEFLDKFIRFMSAFRDALQLKSDKSDAGGENISEAEVTLLVGFLLLSSLTSTATVTTHHVGVSRHKARLIELLEQKVKPRYSELMERIGSNFHTEFYGDSAYIGIDYALGPLKFMLWFGWEDQKGLRSFLAHLNGGVKAVGYHFFQTQLGCILPGMKLASNLRGHHYITFETVALEDFSVMDEGAQLNRYEKLIYDLLDTLLPVLEKTHQEHNQEITRLQLFASRIGEKLSVVYPLEEGWSIDNQLPTLLPYARLKISHRDWNNRLAIGIEPWGEPLLKNLNFGILNFEGIAAGAKEGLTATCDTVLFDVKEEGKSWSNNASFIYGRPFPAQFRNAYKGFFGCPDGELIFKNEDEENAAINAYVEKIARFKQITAQLNALANSTHKHEMQ